MSCLPRPQPHAKGMAATSASVGTNTNTATRKRCATEVGWSSRSASAVRTAGVTPPPAPAATAAVPLMPFVPRASEVGDMTLLLVSCPAGEAFYAYVTVAYDTVG